MTVMTTDGASLDMMVVPTEVEASEDMSLEAVPPVILHFPCSILTIYVPKSGGCSTLLLLADKVPMFRTSPLLVGAGGVWYFSHAVVPEVTVNDVVNSTMIRFAFGLQ